MASSPSINHGTGKGAGQAPQPLVKLSKLDVYVRQLRLLTRAEYPSSTLERMLAVNRLMIGFLLDILRPGKTFRDTPTVLIGSHYLSEREIGPSGALDGCLRGYVQEISTFDPAAKPYSRQEEGIQIASMSVRTNPEAIPHVKGPKRGKGESLRVNLNGAGDVWFGFHEEEYKIVSLPDLILNDPMSLHCSPDFAGELEIECKASGLTSSLKFSRGKIVQGSVCRLLGANTDKYCSMEGSWDSKIHAHSSALDLEGTMFDSAELCPPGISSTLNLQSLGPQQMPRFWSALMDSILYSDRKAANSPAAQDLADHIATNLVFALDPRTSSAARRMKMIRNSGGLAPQQKNKRLDDSDDEDEKLYVEEKYDSDPRSLPPCVKEQRAKGKTMQYQLHYNLRLVPNNLFGSSLPSSPAQLRARAESGSGPSPHHSQPPQTGERHASPASTSADVVVE